MIINHPEALDHFSHKVRKGVDFSQRRLLPTGCEVNVSIRPLSVKVFFKLLYQSRRRLVVRSGDDIF